MKRSMKCAKEDGVDVVWVPTNPSLEEFGTGSRKQYYPSKYQVWRVGTEKAQPP